MSMPVTILGTSHIAAQSIREITAMIHEQKPDIVAVELDIHRAAALFQDGKTKLNISQIVRIGIKGYLFAKIGQYIQQKLGQKVGIMPGADMKTALEVARKEKIQVALIDQPLPVTLRKLELPWREKGRFLADILKGLLFPKKQMKELGLDKVDLRKVPGRELIQKMTAQLKARYPSVYKTLVEDRNRYMVKKLVRLMREHKGKKILAVVGAGHEGGMKELLLKVDVVG